MSIVKPVTESVLGFAQTQNGRGATLSGNGKMPVYYFDVPIRKAIEAR